MKVIYVLSLLILLASCDNFWYARQLFCLANNTIRCTKWNQSTVLSYQAIYLGFCFSEQTHTLTRDGPKSMKDLRLGDEVLSYDPETGKQVYSKVTAWLYRNTEIQPQYDELRTKEGLSFEASPYHNIAYVTPEGKIDFKFSEDFKEGDELVGFPEKDPIVETVAKGITKTGQYTPYTGVGNYYIFGTNFTGGEADSNEPMILVHVLSHVKNPVAEFPIARKFVKLVDLFGLHRQPADNEVYMHPLFNDFSFLFGSNWVQGPPIIVHQFYHDQSMTPSTTTYSPSYSSSYSSSSYSPSYSSSYSSVFGTSYSSSTCYSTKNSRCQRQDRMKALGLSVSVVQETILF